MRDLFRRTPQRLGVYACEDQMMAESVKAKLERIRSHLYGATPELRILAGIELSSMQFADVLDEVRSSLDQDNDDLRFAVEALLRCNATAAIKYVGPLLHNGDDYTRWWICEILSACPTTAATELLTETALKDPDAETRVSAVCALAVLDGPSAGTALTYIRDNDHALDYEAKSVGEIAACMLSTVTGGGSPEERR